MSDEPVPYAVLMRTHCDECGDNEVDGVCSRCFAHVCGSCFNDSHEYWACDERGRERTGRCVSPGRAGSASIAGDSITDGAKRSTSARTADCTARTMARRDSVPRGGKGQGDE